MTERTRKELADLLKKIEAANMPSQRERADMIRAQIAEMDAKEKEPDEQADVTPA